MTRAYRPFTQKDVQRGTREWATNLHSMEAELADHEHDAADITSGTMATARLGSGSATSSTFLRGDSAWAAPATGGEPIARMTYDTAKDVSTTSASFADVDSANLVITFTAPAGGSVYVILEAVAYASSVAYHWGLRETSSDVAGSDVRVLETVAGEAYVRSRVFLGPFTGLSGSYTWKWSHRVSSGGSTGTLQSGGTTDSPAIMEVWEA